MTMRVGKFGILVAVAAVFCGCFDIAGIALKDSSYKTPLFEAKIGILKEDPKDSKECKFLGDIESSRFPSSKNDSVLDSQFGLQVESGNEVRDKALALGANAVFITSADKTTSRETCFVTGGRGYCEKTGFGIKAKAYSCENLVYEQK